MAELLKEIAPWTSHVGVMDPDFRGFPNSCRRSIRGGTSDFHPYGRNKGEIEKAIEGLAQLGNGGLIASTAAPANSVERGQILNLRGHRYRLFTPSFLARGGGLPSYGFDLGDIQSAATYVARILNGEKV